MGILIGEGCVAQTAASTFNCSNACFPQPVVLTHPMAWTGSLKCRSKTKKKAVTSSKVHLPSYVGRSEDLTEKPLLPASREVASVETWIPNWPEVSSGEP